jgi:hypothetical protein
MGKMPNGVLAGQLNMGMPSAYWHPQALPELFQGFFGNGGV